MNAAIILSGGIGSRLGMDTPKQYITVSGKTILEYTLENFWNIGDIQYIVLIVDPLWEDLVSQFIPKGFHKGKKIIYSHPGETRQLSIYNGLRALSQEKNINKVLIHDGARPSVNSRLIYECLSNCTGDYDGVLPVLPVKDTTYYSKDGEKIDALLARETLFSGQTPEVFTYDKYYKAHEMLSLDLIRKFNGSSELAFSAGMKIKLIPGDIGNYKITDSSDLLRFKWEHL